MAFRQEANKRLAQAYPLKSGLTPRRLLAESSHNQNLRRNDFVLGGSIIESRANG